jgi:hypothetical protein
MDIIKLKEVKNDANKDKVFEKLNHFIVDFIKK